MEGVSMWGMGLAIWKKLLVSDRLPLGMICPSF